VKNMNSEQARLRLEVRYNPKRTDPESLATALDRLLETALSTPGIMDDYGNPTFGPCWVAEPGDSASISSAAQSGSESHLVLPNQLSREALEGIVANVQGLLYLDLDRSGREFWNPAKEWSGADLCDDIQNVLNQYGLVPAEEQECTPPATASAPSSAAELAAWAQSQGLAAEDLDDEIHDQASAVASDTNNRGLAAQIEFLVQHVGIESTRELLSELTSDNTSEEPMP
jgi:hypothetical protein